MAKFIDSKKLGDAIACMQLENLLEDCKYYEFNGASGLHYGYNWYTVVMWDDTELDVYVR